jgi:formamidopyrimidine-DNA glycosylase
MPELPEVETIKRDLEERIVGLKIQKIEIRDARVIRGISKEQFTKSLRGQTFTDIHRRGKALIFDFTPGKKKLVVQLMMTGQFILAAERQSDKAVKVILALSNGEYLHYNDQRLFGRLQLVEELTDIPYFHGLGPEPLAREFPKHKLTAALERHKMPIKTLLLNHRFVSGIGNIYASEILFVGGIRPEKPACNLISQEVRRLTKAIPQVLKAAVKARGTSMNTYRDGLGQRGNYLSKLKVYGRQGEPCGVCGAKVEKIVLSGRSTFFCPDCQR